MLIVNGKDFVQIDKCVKVYSKQIEIAVNKVEKLTTNGLPDYERKKSIGPKDTIFALQYFDSYKQFLTKCETTLMRANQITMSNFL